MCFDYEDTIVPPSFKAKKKNRMMPTIVCSFEVNFLGNKPNKPHKIKSD